jgi:hypothetical protein
VELHGLVNVPHLNGHIGVADRVNEQGRYVVRDAASGQTFNVSPANVSASSQRATTIVAAQLPSTIQPPTTIQPPAASTQQSPAAATGFLSDVVQPGVSIQPSAYIFPEEVRPSQVVTNHLGRDGLLGGQFQSALLPVEFATASSAAAVSASTTVRPASWALLSSAALSWAAPHDLSYPPEDDCDDCDCDDCGCDDCGSNASSVNPAMPGLDSPPDTSAAGSDVANLDDLNECAPVQSITQPASHPAASAFSFAHCCQGGCCAAERASDSVATVADTITPVATTASAAASANAAPATPTNSSAHVDMPPATATAASTAATPGPATSAEGSSSSAELQAELQDHKLALKQMKAKLMAQAAHIEELEVQQAEEEASRAQQEAQRAEDERARAEREEQSEVQHKVELQLMADEVRGAEEALGELLAAKGAAEEVLRQRVATLQQQIGGGNWLSAVGNAKRDAATVKAQKATIDELSQLAGGPRLRAKGENLLKYLQTHAAAVKAGILPDLLAEHPSQAKDVDLHPARVDQLCAHLEMQLMGAGAGNVARTRLLISSLMKRPAVQRLMGKSQTHEERLNKVARQMVKSAAGVLGHLTTGKRGSRSLEDHERFETIVAALTPDDASSLHVISTIEELLGIDHKQIERAQVRQSCLTPLVCPTLAILGLPDSNPDPLASSSPWQKRRQVANKDGANGAFSRATKISRKQRKDYRGWGRRVAIDYWHKITRLDTNVGKKKRNREVCLLPRRLERRALD